MVNQNEVPMPRFGKSPIELINDKYDEPKSLTNIYGIPFVGGVFGAAMHGMANWTYKRPRYAGAHRYIIYFAMGATLAHLGERYRQHYWAERDAVLRHYIELHPEDFPPPDRRLYADVLQEWVPCR